MLNGAAVPKQITIYDMNGEVVASFYGAVRPVTSSDSDRSKTVHYQYATLFEDAGNVYMVRWESLRVTD